ncbi:MAG TPA: hypothetical protein VF274_02590 [Alphaproteobacteria bacterium]
MTGVTLSRWTMSYFAAALGALILGEALMAAGYGFPSAPVRAPETLVLVHLVAVGWLSLLLCGALFQFVPVLIARPLHSDTLPLPTLALLLAGLAGLLGGFLQLAGTIDLTPMLLPSGAACLAAGFALALYNLGRTLWQARPLPLPARFVTVSLLCLAATVAFGAVFGVVLATPVQSETLLVIAGVGLPLHVVAGLGGWLTFAAMGVSYRLLAMFMLAPELQGGRTHLVFWLGTGALAASVVGGLLLLIGGGDIGPALSVGGVLGAAALALYGADIVHLYRARKRRLIELNSQMAALALISLAAAAVLALVLIVLGRLPGQVGALVFLVAFGWLTGLGLAKLYKIVAFLTWLECYGPILGKAPTPRVQDLVVEPRARKWFVLYFVAVWGATAALLVPHIPAFRLAAAAMTIATLAIAAQLLRTRRLSNVTAGTRLPEGARRPRLLVATQGSS